MVALVWGNKGKSAGGVVGQPDARRNLFVNRWEGFDLPIFNCQFLKKGEDHAFCEDRDAVGTAVGVVFPVDRLTVRSWETLGSALAWGFKNTAGVRPAFPVGLSNAL